MLRFHPRLRNRQHTANLGRIQPLFVRHQHGAFEDIAQFADISRPGISAQDRQGPRREAAFLAAGLFRNLRQQVVAQHGNIGTPFTQGRQCQRQNVQPIIQIGPETPPLHQRLKVNARRRNHPNVHPLNPVGTQGLDFALLEDAQQLRLQRQRHVADFIEKKGPAVGEFELSLAAIFIGAGIGARSGPEKFGFEQVFRNGRRVDRDKRLVGARRTAVNGVRDQFLAGARFTLDEDGAVETGRTLGQMDGLQGGRTGADNLVE
ncbi:MAG: hypothetical protein BWY57_00641 [Betaproteobacteria bacterium ADurb.Bin341]|nr:MAG: hypothetical protein BWY57_00641 [Betaproteobacteria bacterium ADurb.Bin341]